MVLKLYYDLMSQPARSLYILLKLSKIPFQPCIVNLGKGEHLTEEFAINKSKIQKVPFIHDGDFKLNESIAIVRYLSREYNLDDKWYPLDSKKQAKVDELLEWNHLNIRLNSSSYFISKFVLPLKTGKEASPQRLEQLKKYAEKSLKDFQRIFLTESNKFVFGDQISYADIHVACEIEQTRMVGLDARDKFPIIMEWIENVRKECNPVYDDAHKFVNRFAAVYNEEKVVSKL